ncbi:metallophosphoesterase family protein [Carboxydocella sp. ULO1]|uniref:metallophosphoesterase family protein n=1 Tax=Carboxydocella sp. ULO1 TaxID=1926599 RepID=UPI0009AD8F8D|nr:metallophosphoesterase family protein [Carboxydocella sp. ULO1]GAW27697.1 hypothetical protein ULO1_02670 [Carboxydocella sp. ULO1]
MKLLFLTDTHIRGTSPVNRLDNFPQTLLAKLKEVVELAHDLGVSAVLHGGDLFDLPSPALGVAGEFLAVFQQLRVPFYGIAGNHDLFGHNLATLDRTMLGLAARLGLVRLLAPGERVYLQDKGIRLQLTGTGYHVDLDRRDPRLDYCVTKEECDVAVHLVHGMLLEKRWIEGMAHTLVDQITSTEADFTLCGHNHLGIKDMQAEGKWFLNPGSLVRLSNHPREMERQPQVLLLDFSGGAPTYRKIPLQTARPGSEVLDRSKAEAQAVREAKLAAFVSEVRQAGQVKAYGLQEIVEEIARRDGIPERVRHLALAKLAEAQKRLGAVE